MQQFKVISETNSWDVEAAMNAAAQEGYRFLQLDTLTNRVFMVKEDDGQATEYQVLAGYPNELSPAMTQLATAGYVYVGSAEHRIIMARKVDVHA